MFSLAVWNNPRDENDVRIYINGTTRQKLYFKRAAIDGRVVWASKTSDTPPKFRTGDHYGKMRKDGDAALEVAEAYGVEIGQGTGEAEWDRLMQAAQSGLMVESAE